MINLHVTTSVLRIRTGQSVSCKLALRTRRVLLDVIRFFFHPEKTVTVKCFRQRGEFISYFLSPVT
jgi:hypothetical protein